MGKDYCIPGPMADADAATPKSAAPEQAHTPGPWRVEGSRGAGKIISAGINAYRDGPASYVCIIQPDQGPLNPADVELICEAPRLLADREHYKALLRERDEWIVELIRERDALRQASEKAREQGQ